MPVAAPRQAGQPVRNMLRATVKVISSLKPNHRETLNRHGSGCHIGEGYVLSCAHILRRGWKPVIHTTDNKEYEAEIVATDALLDLSLLKVKDEAFKDVPMVPLTKENPLPDEKATLSGMRGGYHIWGGTVRGYQGRDVLVRGTGTLEGDSGGPIVVGGAIASVIQEFDVENQDTIGPCTSDVVKFVEKTGGVKLVSEFK